MVVGVQSRNFDTVCLLTGCLLDVFQGFNDGVVGAWVLGFQPKHVLEDEGPRPLCLEPPDDIENDRAPGISDPQALPPLGEWLAGEPRAENVGLLRLEELWLCDVVKKLLRWMMREDEFLHVFFALTGNHDLKTPSSVLDDAAPCPNGSPGILGAPQKAPAKAKLSNESKAEQSKDEAKQSRSTQT